MGILPPNSQAARCRSSSRVPPEGGGTAANRRELHMKLWATLFLAAGLCAPGVASAQVGAGVQVGPVGVGAGVGTNGVGAGAHVGTVGAHAGVGVGGRYHRYHRCRGGWYYRHHHRICRRW